MKRNKLGKLFISVMALMSMTSCHDYLDNIYICSIKYPNKNISVYLKRRVAVN